MGRRTAAVWLAAASVFALGVTPARAAGFEAVLVSPDPIPWSGYDAGFARAEIDVTNTGATSDLIVVTGITNPPGTMEGGAVSSPTPGLPLEPGATGRITVWLGSGLSSPYDPGVSGSGLYDFTVHMRASVAGIAGTLAVTVDRTFPGAPTDGTLSGTVVDARSNAPIAGARIRVFQHAGGPDTTGSTQSSAGAFTLNVPAGAYRMSVDAVGYASKLNAVTVAAGETTSVAVRLARAAVVRGSTTPASTTLPLPVFRAGASSNRGLVATLPGFFTRTPETGDGSLTVLDGTGVVAWEEPLPPQSSAPDTVLGLTATDGAADVAAGGARVGVATSGGTFEVYDAAGTLLWDTDRATDVNPLIPGGWGQGIIFGTAMRFSPDGSVVAAGAVTGHVYLFDADDGTLLWKYATAGEVRALAFARDGATLFAGSGDETLYALDTADGSERWSAPLTFWPWHSIATTTDGSRVAVGGKDGIVRVFDATGAQVRALQFPGFVHGLAYTPDGKHLIVDAGAIYDYAPDGTLRWARRGGGIGGEKGDLLTANGRYVATGIGGGGLDGATIQVYDLSGSLVWEYTPAPSADLALYHMRLAPNGSKLIATGRSGGDGVALVFGRPFWPPIVAAVASPSASSQTSRDVAVRWRATDAGGGVANWDVRWRRKRTGTTAWGSYQTWRSATTATGGTYRGARGYTYCFSARGRDAGGHVFAWSAPRCTSIR